MTEKDILFERGAYWIKAADSFEGFEVYRISDSGTHSTRCARIGYTGQEGMQRAIAEINRRCNIS